MCWSWHGGVRDLVAVGCFRRWLFHRLGRSLRGAQELRASAPEGCGPRGSPEPQEFVAGAFGSGRLRGVTSGEPLNLLL